MSRRKSIHVAGVSHVNPIPNASRIGNLVVSGGIGGADAATGAVPDTLEDQCANMFANMRAILQASGASPDDIIKVTVWLKDRGDRKALNVEWLKMFPDEHSRPARHSQQLPESGKMLVQCDFMAVLGD